MLSIYPSYKIQKITGNTFDIEVDEKCNIKEYYFKSAHMGESKRFINFAKSSFINMRMHWHHSTKRLARANSQLKRDTDSLPTMKEGSGEIPKKITETPFMFLDIIIIRLTFLFELPYCNFNNFQNHEGRRHPSALPNDSGVRIPSGRNSLKSEKALQFSMCHVISYY